MKRFRMQCLFALQMSVFVSAVAVMVLLSSMALSGCSKQETAKTGAEKTVDKVADTKSKVSAVEQGATNGLTPQGPVISVDELKKILDNKEDVFLLDVRSQREFDAVHVPDVDLVIPHTQVAQQVDKLPKDKDRLIDVICRTGHRSGIAIETLKSLGYTNLHNVAGGTNAWVAAGYPVVRQ